LPSAPTAPGAVEHFSCAVPSLSGKVIEPHEFFAAAISRSQISGRSRSTAITLAPWLSSSWNGPIAAPAPSSTK